MIAEFFAHLFTLDITWFIWLIQANLFWLFAFTVFMWVFFEGKNVLIGFLLLVFNVWVFIDIVPVTGWVLFVGGFLFLFYITRLAVMLWAEDDEFLRKNLLLVINLHFFGLWIFYNLFLR